MLYQQRNYASRTEYQYAILRGMSLREMDFIIRNSMLSLLTQDFMESIKIKLFIMNSVIKIILKTIIN